MAALRLSVWSHASAGRAAALACALLLAACGNAAQSTGESGTTDDDNDRDPDRPRPSGDTDGTPDDDDAGLAEDTGAPLDGGDSGTPVDGSSDATASVDTGLPSDTGGGTDTTVTPDAGPVGTGGFVGRVWAPGNAPGMVPEGQEIPVSGALVYLSSTAPAPIPTGAYCAACQTPPSRAVLTDAQGGFELTGYGPGRYFLVIEKGQFRRQIEIDVVSETPVALPADQTTLPSRNAPDEGLFTPRIAMAVGASDHLEDILGKMDLGDVDSSGRYIPESSRGVIDIWSNGGTDGGISVGSLEDLVRDPSRMDDYHIIFIPCSGTSNTDALQDAEVLNNIRNYVAAGGNLYVTDWSGEWHDNVFPAQIELQDDGFGGIFDFGEGIDTPASAYNATTNTWDTSEFGNADGSSYDTPNAEVVDTAMLAWLDGQFGPTAEDDAPSRYNARNFDVVGNWNAIVSVNPVEVGTDRLGVPIIDTPKVWVIGGTDTRPNPKRPLTVSYEPTGCGRVLYSTYHTTEGVHLGLAPQERVLLYLIMEIGTCRNPKQ